ncbi:MAG: bifunctional hydroxymethylpyrimidine kinase/phosphomethylpyrimidine kinase, partial [Lentisphaerae bacterium]|nr:bifunctional hydroxymethylpyrimidine kinase/phosphomethylpyrimidine kinase [Lentisphaerota bacterium]
IAGSDSGGGAGIQADLKTFAAFGVFGTSAITCITAQNPAGVDGIEPVSPGMVALQVRAVSGAFPIAAAKTGMLFSDAIIRATAEAVRDCGIRQLVVDPVMVATSGARLLKEDAVSALVTELMPLAGVVTPNLPEAAILCGRDLETLDDMRAAAEEISRRFDVSCLLKGGHMEGNSGEMTDVLCHGGEVQTFSSPRVPGAETHGTGCSFSAAMTACLASGEDVVESARRAKQFVSDALARPFCTGSHRPLGIMNSR